MSKTGNREPFQAAQWGSSDCLMHIFEVPARPAWIIGTSEKGAIRRAIKQFGSVPNCFRHYLDQEGFKRSEDRPIDGDRILGHDRNAGYTVGVVKSGRTQIRIHNGLRNASWTDRMTPEVYRRLI